MVYALVRWLGAGGWFLGSVLAVAQGGVVGWAWKAASTGTDLNAAMSAFVHLFPMQWATSAITVAGNGGQSPQLWMALAILGVIAVAAFVLVGAPAGRADKEKA